MHTGTLFAIMALLAVCAQAQNGTVPDCGCALKKQGLKITCDKTTVQKAFDALGTSKCSTDCSSTACVKNWLVVTSAHDYCEHEDLPEAIEKGFHTFEEKCAPNDCLVKRKYNSALPMCPTPSCSNSTATANAITQLTTLGCSATTCATNANCTAAYRLLRAVHDLCPTVQGNVLTVIHDYEDPCEAAGCNGADAKYDPNACSQSSASSFSVSGFVIVVIIAMLTI